MADNTPGPTGGDPFEDRLRATFAAERADVERRHLAHDPAPARSQQLRWIPFAAAATAIAIAGFLFIGNRTDETAVELDVAAQTGQTDWEVPQPDAPGPTPVGTAQVALVLPPPALPAGMPEIVPYVDGQKFCNDYNPELLVVWDPSGAGAPAQHQPEATGTSFITRRLGQGMPVTLAGGCTSGATSLGVITWYEIEGYPGQPTDWVNIRQLITNDAYQDFVRSGAPPFVPPVIHTATPGPVPAPPPLPPPINNCGGSPVIFPLRFVWGIGPDDPDGGLVAHTAPGINEPVTRILRLDEIVAATGQCELIGSGSKWYELRATDGSLDWVSGRYLAEGVPACLNGEQYGTPARNPESLFHTVQPGDRLSSIAEQYNLTIGVLIRSNPDMDPNVLIAGQRLLIAQVLATQIFGPVVGLAIADGDQVAFAPSTLMEYRWYPGDAVTLNAPCYGDGPTGPVCAVGPIALIDPKSPEPIWVGTGPLPAERTGRLLPTGTTTNMVEIRLSRGDGDISTGFVDPSRTQLHETACGVDTSDSFLTVPCNATDSDVVVGTAERGSRVSTADHVHNIRTEQGVGADGPCTRIVIEFGVGAYDGVDAPADRLPFMTIEKSRERTRVFLPQGMFTGAGEPSRVDGPLNTALLTVISDNRPAIEVLHHQPGPVNVWFLENPARVIIDHLNPPANIDMETGVYGQNFLLSTRIQSDLYGRGVLEGRPIVVTGFGRPFETYGEYRIYAIEPLSDLGALWAANPEPLVKEALRTSSWTDGWGTFRVQLPALAPGTYVAVFGEVASSGNNLFIGTGQEFRVYDPNTPASSSYERVEILPNVRIG